MIRTGSQYLDSIRDGREIYINGGRVKDVTQHAMMKPLIDIRARGSTTCSTQSAIARTAGLSDQGGEWNAIANKAAARASGLVGQAPRDGHRARCDRRRRHTVVLKLAWALAARASAPAPGGRRQRGLAKQRRRGDEDEGRLAVKCGRLFDGQSVLNEAFDPQFSANIRAHIDAVLHGDPFHVSANTDPKGDRSKPPQEQDPDMLLHVVKETDAGIVVRGAKYETAAPYANQAFTKPTIANWGNFRALGLRGRLHLRSRLGQPQIHLQNGIRRPGAARRLSAGQQIRRSRCPGHFRRRADPLGKCALLSAYQGRGVHPGDAAPLFRIRLRAAKFEDGGHADRCRSVQRPADRA